MNKPIVELIDVDKTFTVHHQNGVVLSVLKHVNLSVSQGECLVLDGPSGMGKSTVLKLIYGNYRASQGQIVLSPPNARAVDITQAPPRTVIELRHHFMGYVSQFLRIIPRVSALEIVAESLIEDQEMNGTDRDQSLDKAKDMLSQLNIPMNLWNLPPATFSGGEQQRINIARNLIKRKPVLLLDEPTASLDKVNTQIVVDLIQQVIHQGTAVIGIFHDPVLAKALATQRLDMTQFREFI
jgi:alpha-D-ribose 1-methylphosphonate 5-triphosphate synthase subunit PhnL